MQISDFLTPPKQARIYALENEQRQLRLRCCRPDHFQAAAKIDDAKIKSWYDGHPSDYMSPESVRLQYAELQLDSIASQITVTPENAAGLLPEESGALRQKSRRATRTIS